jgi:ankyrin repeat protein
LFRADDPATDLVGAVESGDWDRAASLVNHTTAGQTQADGATPLHWIAFHGKSEWVPRLVEMGAEANAKTIYDVMPLHIACTTGACTTGHAEVVRQLLKSGADVHATLAGGETPLMLAARTGALDVVNLLIDGGANVDATERAGQTAMMWAAAEGHGPVVDALIEAGADPDISLKSGYTAFMFAAREGRIDVVDRLLAAGQDVSAVMRPRRTDGRAPRDRMSALMLAVESGHFQLAVHLVDAGADPNDQRSGYAPLHALSWVRKTDLGDGVSGDPPPRGSGNLTSQDFVRRLVAAGADANLRLERGNGGRAKLNPRGATPLMMAAKTADLPLVKLLFELGADPLVANADGCTPLMAAAGIGVLAVGEEPGTETEVNETIDWLIQHGADINHVDQNGETAMHGAAYRNYPSTVHCLAAHGARAEIWDQKNRWGWTPEMIAAGKRPGSFKPSPETIEALISVK